MIRVQLSTGPGIGSAFIRWYTWSPFSHVDFVLPDGRLLGARFRGGVQIREPDYSRFTHRLTLQAPAPDSVLSIARSYIGAAYDWRAVAGLGLRRNWHDDRRWFCSELVAHAFALAGYPLLRAHYVNRITPRDICISPMLERVDIDRSSP